MKPHYASLVATVGLFSACSPSPSCKSLPWQQAVELAKDRKEEMLSRSTASYRANFASNVAVHTEGHGYAGVVGFKGKDGRTLVALIQDDCYVGWTEE